MNQHFGDYCRMDEMMRGQRGWRELAVLGDKINKFNGKIEGLIWSPRSSDGNRQVDDWGLEEVGMTFEDGYLQQYSLVHCFIGYAW